MGQSTGLFNRLLAKAAAFIGVGNYMAYKSPVRTFIDVDGQDDDTIPNKTWVKGYVNNSIGQTKTLITSNPFTFNSGITSYYPKPIVTLKTGNVHTPFGVATWDETTGNVTTDVYTGVSGEDYYLWVG